MILNNLIKTIFFTILLQPLQAQVKGIKFEHNIGWDQILAKAKKENKYIFVDCYTTWCGPCKYMTANIFPLEAVGNLYNKNFINVKLQFDSTDIDIDEIKSHYEDAAFIKKKYEINGYPTYLFFNPDGELVHKEGGSSTAEEFITKGTKALTPGSQYYTQVRKYEAGERNATFLMALTRLAINAQDEPAISKYAKEYYLTQKNLLSQQNLQFVYETTLSTKDTGFTLISKNLDNFEAVIDKVRLRNTMNFIIIRSEFRLKNNIGADWNSNDWKTYNKSLLKKYPVFAEDVLFQIQTMVFQGNSNWKAFAIAIASYVKVKPISDQDLNEYAWTIFSKSDDKQLLKKALSWSKKSFTNQTKIEPTYMDTYANLLYKLGRVSEALKWEIRAQKLAVQQGSDKNWGQDVIDKINNRVKTW